MRIAVIYDYLPAYEGGGERLLFDILRVLSPHTDLFLGACIKSPFTDQFLLKLQTQLPSVKVHIARYIHSVNSLAFRLFHYQLPAIMQQLPLTGYHTILCNTSFLAHTVTKPSNSRKIVYMNTPARMLWNLPHSQSFLKRMVPDILLAVAKSAIRLHDIAGMQTADAIYCISKCVQSRIDSFYNRKSEVIYPSVVWDYSEVTPGEVQEIREEFDHYFVHISRIESYKNISLLINATPHIKRPVIIIGEGPHLKQLVNEAAHVHGTQPRTVYSPFLGHNMICIPHIIFTGRITEAKKNALLSLAEASFSLNDEDFGITKVESLAAGTPVIALAAGAAPEIVEDTLGGILFTENTVTSLLAALTRLETIIFDKKPLQARAKQFSYDIFAQQLKQAVGL